MAFHRFIPLFFSTDVHTLSLYKHMVGFVMAYSFTEESPDLPSQAAPVMVPMADILNHRSYNNAHLEFGPKSLKMVATDHIKKAGLWLFLIGFCVVKK